MAWAQSGEFVSNRMPTLSCHASTVVELRGGHFLAGWFGGTQEGAPDVAIWLSEKSDQGWSEPKIAVREPNVASYNPVLFHTADGRLWLYYKFGNSPQSWSAGRLFSKDEGAHWSKPEHLEAGLYGPIRAKPLLLPSGIMLSGTSVESYGSWAAWIERSVDEGETWTRVGPLQSPAASKRVEGEKNPSGSPHGVIQPSLLDLGGGHIRLYARATSDIGRICQADSFDNGLSWTALRTTELRNPNSGIDAVRLKDGRQVMIYNDSADERTPLNLAVSRDEGKSWKKFYTLESAPGEYSYPALIEARNGDLIMTYTWQREKIRFVRMPLSQVP